MFLLSFPTRERGLKSQAWWYTHRMYLVVPHAGTWIEIMLEVTKVLAIVVVPHAGTWIEMPTVWGWSISFRVVPHAGTWIEIDKNAITYDVLKESFPTRERGLKSWYDYNTVDMFGRSPRGNVDWNTNHTTVNCAYSLSFPTRERGLKCLR